MTPEQLKNIVDARLKATNSLILGEDWFWAAYTMAMALECALKAKICGTLGLQNFPQHRDSNKKIVGFFHTHEFDLLLTLAGLIGVFGANSAEDDCVQNWSEFTKEFTGAWTELRYDETRQQQFDRTRVERLLKSLIEKPSGIITKIKTVW